MTVTLRVDTSIILQLSCSLNKPRNAWKIGKEMYTHIFQLFSEKKSRGQTTFWPPISEEIDNYILHYQFQFIALKIA